MSKNPSSTPRKKTSSSKDPHQIARAAVDRYFAAMVDSRDFFLGEQNDAIEKVCEEVYEILEAGTTIDPSDDLIRWALALDAGYLVGVNVGLRLRNIGGAR
jgi:hypothetical protein